MHDKGMMHRDIKAENMVFRDSATAAAAKKVPPQVKIIDLGMAAMYDPAKPVQGARLSFPCLSVRMLPVHPARHSSFVVGNPTGTPSLHPKLLLSVNLINPLNRCQSVSGSESSESVATRMSSRPSSKVEHLATRLVSAQKRPAVLHHPAPAPMPVARETCCMGSLPLTAAAVFEVSGCAAGALGSPGFVAPEIVMDAPHAPSMDVFSLGVVLFIMLVGRKPFNIADSESLAYVHLELAAAPGLRDARCELAAEVEKCSTLDRRLYMCTWSSAPRLACAASGANQLLRHCDS